MLIPTELKQCTNRRLIQYYGHLGRNCQVDYGDVTNTARRDFYMRNRLHAPPTDLQM